MSSGTRPDDAAPCMSMAREDVNNARIRYSRVFLLSVGGSEACRDVLLPAGIGASALIECDEMAPGDLGTAGDSSSSVERFVARWSLGHQGDDDSPGREREPEPSQTSVGTKSKKCTRFFSTDGYRFGDDCHFLHYLPGDRHDEAVAKMNNLSLGGPALTRPPGRTFMDSAVPDRAPRAPATPTTVKSRLCRSYNTAEGCRWGDKCYFAHGEGELGKQMGPGSSFKTRLCESFFSSGSCAFGGRCHFAHGENELR